MSAAHTPGPWSIIEFGGMQIGHEPTGEAVCTMWGSDTDPDDPKLANAHLIAAAPALLLELEMTVDLLERASRTLTEEYKSALDGKQWGGVRIASARAAIALAKGESA